MHTALWWGNLQEGDCVKEDRIKMDLKEICWEGMDWLYLAEERDSWWAFVDGVEPSGFVNTWNFFPVRQGNYLLLKKDSAV
jgi:hypothetical protein